MTTDRPTTITAKEFVYGEYAEKVKRGECFVQAGGLTVKDITPIEDELTEYHIRWSKEGGLGRTFKDSKFTVTWLPDTPQPSPAPATDAAEAVDYLVTVSQSELHKLEDMLMQERQLSSRTFDQLATAQWQVTAQAAVIGKLEAQLQAAGKLVEALSEIAEGAEDGKPVLSEYGTIESFRDAVVRWEIGNQAGSALSSWQQAANRAQQAEPEGGES